MQRFKALGGTPVEVDLTPFMGAARLFYDGAWVAERNVAIRDFIDARPEMVFPPVRTSSKAVTARRRPTRLTPASGSRP